jgi:hypothetical protein
MLQMPSGMEERAKAAPVFNLLLRENLTEELLMSQPTVFGASQAVTMMNLALYGDSYVLTPAEFANQANQATNTASGQYAYANLIAQPASVLSTDAYVTLVLGHMGVDANPLHDAVVAYMDSVGVANRGTVTSAARPDSVRPDAGCHLRRGSQCLERPGFRQLRRVDRHRSGSWQQRRHDHRGQRKCRRYLR